MKTKLNNPLTLILVGAAITVTFLGFKFKNENGTYRTMNVQKANVSDVLKFLGDDEMVHSMVSFDAEKARIGEELILDGRTKVDGKYSKRISKYFVCTDCHNLGREFEVLTDESAEARLNYADENGLSFMPGSTFWGMYNRTSFYNNDYEKKYGALIVDSRDTLQNAVQLCSKYCSSGRYLEDWELESIMHYYKKNELKIEDLSLSENDMKNVQKYAKLKEGEKKDLIETIKNSYVQGYGATFLPTMPTDKRKYGEGGNPETGKKIYDKSCLHCHSSGRVTNLKLDHSSLTGGMFWRNIKKYSDKSLYQIVRHGTYSKTGRKQYMPLYTEEKMSDEQLNDLVAYIKQLAKK
ncbi:MAG: mono/diheme cytochrome c family protein [Crocinitomicaceae bacterium]|jgi:mono/diheme cytochrome c family protein